MVIYTADFLELCFSVQQESSQGASVEFVWIPTSALCSTQFEKKTIFVYVSNMNHLLIFPVSKKAEVMQNECLFFPENLYR